MKMKTEEYVNEAHVPIAKKRRLWLTVLDLILFIALFFVIQMLASMPFGATLQGIDTQDMAANIPVYILLETLMLISGLLAAWFVLRIRKLPLAGLGLSIKGRWTDLPAGILFILCLYAISLSLSLILGAVQIVRVSFHPPFLLSTFLFFFLVALTEEFIVRGFILGRMLDGGVNKFVALLISSAIFSLMHLFNPSFAFVPFLNILLAGIFLGASYIYTRNLCFPIVLHWFWNWLQGPVLGYKVSGNKLGDSLLQLELPEANLINGGTFGFEGSILCTALLVVGSALIIGYYSKKRAK